MMERIGYGMKKSGKDIYRCVNCGDRIVHVDSGLPQSSGWFHGDGAIMAYMQNKISKSCMGYKKDLCKGCGRLDKCQCSKPEPSKQALNTLSKRYKKAYLYGKG